MQYVLIIGLLGVCLGSFINAWVWRSSNTEDVNQKKQNRDTKLSILNGRSVCPDCRHLLAWRDLVPVLSWVSLKGKCRYCRQAISAQYPAVELLTTALFIVSLLLWPFELSGFLAISYFLLWLTFLVILIALSVYDIRYMLLPNKMVALAGIVTVLASGVHAVDSSQPNHILWAGIGALTFGGIFYLLYQVSAGAWIGGGDVKLGFVLGIWLASPLLVLFTIFLASCLGLIVALAMSPWRHIDGKTAIPFGPMLMSATVMVFFISKSAYFLDSMHLLGL
jgi:leader peptidase (prepilin peptidase)/N-methyltransferase